MKRYIYTHSDNDKLYLELDYTRGRADALYSEFNDFILTTKEVEVDKSKLTIIAELNKDYCLIDNKLIKLKPLPQRELLKTYDYVLADYVETKDKVVLSLYKTKHDGYATSLKKLKFDKVNGKYQIKTKIYEPIIVDDIWEYLNTYDNYRNSGVYNALYYLCEDNNKYNLIKKKEKDEEIIKYFNEHLKIGDIVEFKSGTPNQGIKHMLVHTIGDKCCSGHYIKPEEPCVFYGYNTKEFQSLKCIYKNP